MCVWDGTYTAPEAEREAMDEIPGWRDDAAPLCDRRTQPGVSRRVTRRMLARPNAA
jgi:hypothetical protein